MIDPELIRLLEEIKAQPNDQLRPEIITPDLTVELDPYQKKAVHFGVVGRRVIDSDEAGLGKTLTGLGLFSHLKFKGEVDTCLVVAGATAVLNTWKTEIVTNTTFNPVIVLGDQLKGKAARNMAYSYVGSNAPIMVTNYEIFRADYQNPVYTKFGLVLFDESSAFKSYDAAISNAVRHVCARVPRVFLLNATPIEKDVMDLYSQVCVLYPGLLGTPDQFKERYCVIEMQPIMRYNPSSKQQYEIKVPKIVGAKNLDELRARVEWLIIRRLPSDVGIKYPEVEIQQIELPMSLPQYRVYNDLKWGTLQRMNTIRKVAFGVKFNYMLMTCIAPSLVTRKPYEPGESPKFDAILTMAKKFKDAGEPFVVFSRFRVSLESLEKLLLDKGYRIASITGREKSKFVRKQYQDDFNAGKLDILLLNIAGAKSLNLPGSRFLVFLDSTFNPKTNHQVIYRLCRRTSKNPKVFVYVLLIQNTLEQKVMKVLEERTAVSNDVMDNPEPLSYQEMQKAFMEETKNVPTRV